MPFDVLTQLEGQRGVIIVPRPACREIGDYRVEADLRLMLVEHDEIVEHTHHRHLDNEGRRLVDRHVGRAARAREPQDATALLRPGRMAGRKRQDQ